MKQSSSARLNKFRTFMTLRKPFLSAAFCSRRETTRARKRESTAIKVKY